MQQMKRGTYKEDEFQSVMRKIIKYIVRHREISIWIGVGTIIVVILLARLLSTGEPQNPQADLLHTQAMGLMSTGRLQDAENALMELTQKYQNTRPGKIGFYYLGVIYYHTGRFDEALHNFDEFLHRQKNDYLLVPSTLFGAGCAAEGVKDYGKALDYYEKLIKDKESPFYLQGMLAYARVNGILGNRDKARALLEDLIEQNPPLDIASDAKFYLGYFSE